MRVEQAGNDLYIRAPASGRKVAKIDRENLALVIRDNGEETVISLPELARRLGLKIVLPLGVDTK